MNVESVGSGQYSTVFKASGAEAEYVLKVHDNSFGYVDTWPKFAAVAQSHYRSNSLFPQIIYFEEYPEGGYVGIIEALEINPNRLGRTVGKAMKPVIEKMGFFREMMSTDAGAFLAWAEAFNMLNKTRHAGFRHKHFDEIEAAFNQGCAALKITPEQAADFWQKIRRTGRWDLHTGNAGFRKNGQLVIFDPVH